MSASLALAGVSACTRQPNEELVPYVRQPEELVPGKPLFYATAMPFAGSGIGLLIESHEGRPTKIEGNPDHPSSRGATDVFAQAAILGLYDPDRSTTITSLGEIRPFSSFFAFLRSILTSQRPKKGAGLRILTETVASPTLGAQLEAILTALPEARWAQWEPVGRHNAREGSRLAFGEYADAQYSFDRADVVLSLDADFMSTGASGLRHARAFASRRRAESGEPRNRLYAVESTPTVSGTRADHRLPLKPSELDSFARAVAAQLGVAGAAPGPLSQAATAWVTPLVADLQAAKGRSVVIAGDGAPPSVHALAHLMNAALGNVGQTVVYTEAAEVRPSNQLTDLRALVRDMNAGTVDFLLILGGNPVYTAPADLQFGAAMQKVAQRAHVGLYEDETAELCQWHVPEAHFLEAWSDVRSDDGTVTIVQPLIAPLYGGKSHHEVLVALIEGGERSGYDLVREHWINRTGLSTEVPAAAASPVPAPAPALTQAPPSTTAPAAAPAAGAPAAVGPAATPGLPALAPIAGARVPALSPFDREWRRWLHDGVVAGSAFAPKPVTPQAAPAVAAAASASGLEVVFRPDPSVYDGRFANNGWLQELPKTLTKLTWDNAALVAPGTAARLNLVSGDMVRLTHEGRSLEVPVWLAPGQALDTLTLHLGYGRARAGRTGTGLGFNVNALRTSAALDTIGGVQLAKTGDSYALASTQDHWSLEGRNLIRVATAAQFEADPQFAKKQEHQPERLTLYSTSNFKYEGYAWGMAIDQNVCTGCNSCVVACQAENNVPVVGKSQVLNGREMHWLRVDRYYTGNLDTPDTYHQPMPCQQCETAPCEVVCPVVGHGAQRRRPERHGLQPLRGHALLLEQLPIQGAAIQLPAVSGLRHAEPEAGSEPRRHRPQPRRDGEVHLLRAAHQSRARGGQAGRSPDSRRRDRDGVPGRVPHRRDCVRQHQRPRQPRLEAEGQHAQLRAAGGAEHAPAHLLSGRRAKPEHHAGATHRGRRGR